MSDESYFRLEGKEELIKQLNGIGVEVEEGVSETLKEVGDNSRDELRAIIQEGNGFPSEPGEAPHSQTGNLREKIFSRLDKKTFGQEILLTVGTSMKGFYGLILEYGANQYEKGFKRLKHTLGAAKKYRESLGLSQRVLPRPWFWSTIERFWEKAPVEVESAVNKVLKKYAD